jgi:N utilization substance protein B
LAKKRQWKGYFLNMAQMTRKEAREEAFRLLFETEFQKENDPAEIYALSKEDREFLENDYIKTVYFGVQEHMAEIDEMIMRHSKGWKTERITPVSRSVIRLCIFEMLYLDDIPNAVSLNEAIELVKRFDDLKMKAFVNGLLNGAKNEIEEAKK